MSYFTLRQMTNLTAQQIKSHGLKTVIENMPLPICKLIRRLENGWSLKAALAEAKKEKGG